MDADAIMEDAKRRLLALTVNPPFRFKRTARIAAQWYMHRLTTFEGSSAQEIVSAEAELHVQFTDVFRAYLRHMGRSCGSLFRGIKVAQPSQFTEFREFGQELMHETSELLSLPVDAVILLTHQGYSFTFMQPCGGFDCPLLNYTEGESGPIQIADSFEAFIDAQLKLIEENHRKSHEIGGHYIRVFKNGTTKSEYLALASGDRATSKPFKLGDWWRFL